MATSIKKIDQSTYEVNNKRVVKDMDEKWIEQTPLTQNEARDFSLHLVKIAEHE